MYSYSNKKKNGIGKTLLTIFLTAGITILISEYVLPKLEANTKDQGNKLEKLDVTVNETPPVETTPKENTVPTLLKNLTPSVVGIAMLKPDGVSIFDVDTSGKWGLGTGIIVSSDGYILTNQHLATTKNSKIIVTLENGETTEGTVLWTEPVIDLAIVKINAKNLIPATLGNSEEVEVGERVLAIGNPLGLEFQRTVTSGIVSALNRTLKIEVDDTINFMEDLIQTDASINPGNSGGPLIKETGEVIGINTIKVTSAEGIGFAVPVNVVKPVIESFIKTGEFKESYIGIYAHDKEVVPYMDSKVDMDRGIYVASVDKNGPCGKSGLKVGDIITHIDGNEINKMVELRTYIYQKQPGDKVELSILSNQREKTIEITLANKKNETGLAR